MISVLAIICIMWMAIALNSIDCVACKFKGHKFIETVKVPDGKLAQFYCVRCAKAVGVVEAK